MNYHNYITVFDASSYGISVFLFVTVSKPSLIKVSED